ncbi:hypothetical protein ALC53_00776 [Atta colombica]|uniref:Uncharacterized protein n=1 Tax=Atta colombica TaxID=520822 RepID=A0A195BWI1_9HYME|nr:hypothetical protein ALC53_00776 [Atta colombica]
MCVYKTKVGERDKEYPLKLSVWGFVMIDGPVCPEIIFVQLVRKQPWRPCRVPITTACVNSVKHQSITTRMAATRATVTTTATVTSHDTNRLQGSKASVTLSQVAADSWSLSPRGYRILYAFRPTTARCVRPCTYVWTWYTRGTWCKRGIRGRGYTLAANDEGDRRGEAEGKLYSRWSLLLQARQGRIAESRRGNIAVVIVFGHLSVVSERKKKTNPRRNRGTSAVFLVRDQLIPTPLLSGSFLEIVVRQRSAGSWREHLEHFFFGRACIMVVFLPLLSLFLSPRKKILHGVTL